MEEENHVGKRIGSLVLIEKQDGKYHGCNWICKCDCGKEVVLKESMLKTRRSCGCKRYEYIGKAHIKHGHVYEKLNHIWRGMKQRCKNPNNKTYPYYGGRGIKVCPEWDESYATFREWAYANGYYETTTGRNVCTLDRIDGNGDYEPSNCRWVDMKEQSNNRRSNHPITYKGETYNITEWSRRLGMQEATLSLRLRKGWSIERAFETPVDREKRTRGNDEERDSERQ